MIYVYFDHKKNVINNLNNMKSLIESLLDDDEIQADKLIDLVENIEFDNIENIHKEEDWDDFVNNMREHLKMFSKRAKFKGIELDDKRGTYYIRFIKRSDKKYSLSIGSRSNHFIFMYFNKDRKKLVSYDANSTMNDVVTPYDEIYIMDDRLVKNWKKNKSKFNG